MCFGSQEYYIDCQCPGRFIVTDQCRQWTCNARVEDRIVWLAGRCERCRAGQRPAYSASQVSPRSYRQPQQPRQQARQQQQQRGGRGGHPTSRFRTLDELERYHGPIVGEANRELQRARTNWARAQANSNNNNHNMVRTRRSSRPWAQHTLRLAQTDVNRANRDYDEDLFVFCRERGRINNRDNDVDFYSSGDSDWSEDEGN
ncbi:MAG: hypothetical protein M1815_002670 [Lichina confinis]|nr:MAG: hypothetical protein M1815_002670 [Lichina confinis]